MTVTRISLFGAATVALCMLAVAQPAAAQQKEHFRPMATPHMKPTTRPELKPHETRVERERREDTRAFRGVASRLGMTPEALDEAFEAARQANHGLTRGEFIAANMLAHDLGAAHPNITTQAILDQLKTRNNLGRALQSLGLSKQQAKQAMKEANKEVKEADKAVDRADKDRDRKPDTH